VVLLIMNANNKEHRQLTGSRAVELLDSPRSRRSPGVSQEASRCAAWRPCDPPAQISRRLARGPPQAMHHQRAVSARHGEACGHRDTTTPGLPPPCPTRGAPRWPELLTLRVAMVNRGGPSSCSCTSLIELLHHTITFEGDGKWTLPRSIGISRTADEEITGEGNNQIRRSRRRT